MDEKEEPVKGSGGGAVVDKEEKQRVDTTGSEGSRKSSTSKRSNGKGEMRESIESTVSPSLNRLIVGGAEDGSSNKPEVSIKAQRRARERARKKAKKDSASDQDLSQKNIPPITASMQRDLASNEVQFQNQESKGSLRQKDEGGVDRGRANQNRRQ